MDPFTGLGAGLWISEWLFMGVWRGLHWGRVSGDGSTIEMNYFVQKGEETGDGEWMFPPLGSLAVTL
jgi:hypothetical protein